VFLRVNLQKRSTLFLSLIFLQVGILAVGGGSSELCPDTGKAVTLMRSTLSFDRRFVDEALAADFMATLQRIIERPEFMNLGLVPVARRAISS